MVKLIFREEAGLQHTCEVNKRTRLADVQRPICRLFKKRFPITKATLATRGGFFDEFMQQPFLETSDGDIVVVSFEQTDEPLFFDLADRAPHRAWAAAEEELKFEIGQAREATVTSASHSGPGNREVPPLAQEPDSAPLARDAASAPSKR